MGSGVFWGVVGGCWGGGQGVWRCGVRSMSHCRSESRGLAGVRGKDCGGVGVGGWWVESETACINATAKKMKGQGEIVRTKSIGNFNKGNIKYSMKGKVQTVSEP